MGLRIVALLIVGVGYLMHRKEQRNADFRGLERPNGWVAGLACLFLGAAAMAGYLVVVSS